MWIEIRLKTSGSGLQTVKQQRDEDAAGADDGCKNDGFKTTKWGRLVKGGIYHLAFKGGTEMVARGVAIHDALSG